ncbi:MAG TPA: CHAT domain-containing protein, partial [Ginsengibacter sp.]|nr:CHAT domain-containing protein [Ginsengibacter sp.]
SKQLLDMFYENLLGGMEKDDALRAAKLEYLRNEKGRTANPHFWAGLVIMGDTSAIALEEKDYTWNYILEGLALMLAGTTIYIILKRRSRRKRLMKV